MTKEKIGSRKYTQDELDLMANVQMQLVEIIETYYSHTKFGFDLKMALMAKMLTFVLLKFRIFDRKRDKETLDLYLEAMMEEVKEKVFSYPEFLKSHSDQ
jgi:hypothetical protein